MKFVTSLVCAAAAIACLPAAHADVLAKAKESGEITFAYDTVYIVRKAGEVDLDPGGKPLLEHHRDVHGELLDHQP